MLEAIGMTVVDEHGARQRLYTPAGDQDDSDLRWLRLFAARRDAVERRRGTQARATAAGQNLPDDLAALTPPRVRVTWAPDHEPRQRLSEGGAYVFATQPWRDETTVKDGNVLMFHGEMKPADEAVLDTWKAAARAPLSRRSPVQRPGGHGVMKRHGEAGSSGGTAPAWNDMP
ncbi:hypothetical protein AB0D49_29150 [Streptomyces sp. NPDC048290]|uniref:hypothetical protein n=1 Tax=Streptomyces sp. NPDC048290 TaxID=3155811 RepID=UPI00342DB1C9